MVSIVNHRYTRAIAGSAGIAKVEMMLKLFTVTHLSSYHYEYSVRSGAPKVKTLRELVVGISNSTPHR